MNAALDALRVRTRTAVNRLPRECSMEEEDCLWVQHGYCAVHPGLFVMFAREFLVFTDPSLASPDTREAK